MNVFWLDGFETEHRNIMAFSMNASVLLYNEELGDLVEVYQSALFDTVSADLPEIAASKAFSKGLQQTLSNYNARKHLDKLYLRQIDSSYSALDAVNKPNLTSIEEGIYLSFEDFRDGFSLPYTAVDFIERRGLNNGLRQLKLPDEEKREFWGVFKEGQLFLHNGDRKLLPVLIKEDQVVIEKEAIDPGEAGLYAAFSILGGGLIGAAIAADLALFSEEKMPALILDYASGSLIDHSDWTKRYEPNSVMFYADYFMKKNDKLKVQFDDQSCVLRKNEVAIFSYPIDSILHQFTVNVIGNDNQVRGAIGSYKSTRYLYKLNVDKKTNQPILELLEGSQEERVSDEIIKGRITEKCSFNLESLE